MPSLKDTRASILVFMSAALRNKIAHLATRNDRSLSETAVRLLAHALQEPDLAMIPRRSPGRRPGPASGKAVKR